MRILDRVAAMTMLLLALALTGSALAGCAATPATRSDRNPDSPPLAGAGVGPESAAIGLVNLWRVSGAAGEGVDTWLRLDVPEFQLWSDCGLVVGSWLTTETLFVATTSGASSGCASGGGIPGVPWLESVVSYSASGDGWQLSNSDGEVVATLTLDGAPEPDPNAAEIYTKPPVITDAVRAAMHQAAAVPPGLTPATGDELIGRWVPVAYSVSTGPHVVFNADGTWTGSDGCNGGGGRWVADDAGAFLAAAGPSTLMGCEGAPVPYWVAQARSAVIDDGWLLLLDASGSEVGRLERG
ncbi:META domain-containing protein [Glaciihabitans tibetensis]|uniref:META domain-containing protein n=1 Tax=Glaciihabitans tibetensis TaxID=1266600 RepID=A0A2T0VBU4_9MICO|nr:META domain-containing protein [Glaciihabitans tibetensis]PRY67665.1 META domain-containing protein [Glaciihabitans tibetensis]